MIIAPKITKTRALVFYLVLGFFPGLMCAHFLRLAAISNDLFSFILGCALLVAPFVILALLLTIITKSGTEYDEHQRRRDLFLGFGFLVISIILLILCSGYSNKLYEIFSDEAQLNNLYSGNTTPFYFQWITAWLGAYSLGLAFLKFVNGLSVDKPRVNQ